jgi:hypothetical protein
LLIVEGGNLLLKKRHIDMLKEREYNNYGWVQFHHYIYLEGLHKCKYKYCLYNEKVIIILNILCT